MATNAGCAVIPFRIDESKLGKGLEYYLGVVHWLDAITPPLEKNIHKLERLIAKILSSEDENPYEPPSPQKTEWWSKVKNKIFVRRSRKSKIAAWVSLGLVCAVLLFDMLWLDPIYAPDFPDIPLSRVDDEYMYLSSGEALITDDLKEAILYDGEKDRYLLQKLDTMSTIPMGADFSKGYSSIYHLTLVGTSSMQVAYFFDNANATVNVWNKEDHEWVVDDAINLDLSRTEEIHAGYIDPVMRARQAVATEQNAVGGEDLVLIAYETSEPHRLTKIFTITAEGSIRVLDISSHNLLYYVTSVEQENQPYWLMHDGKKLALLNYLTGEVLNLSHEEIVREYLPHARENGFFVNAEHASYFMLSHEIYEADVYQSKFTVQEITEKEMKTVYSNTFYEGYVTYFYGDTNLMVFDHVNNSLCLFDLANGGEKNVVLDQGFFEKNKLVFESQLLWMDYMEEIDKLIFVVSTKPSLWDWSVNCKLVVVDMDGTILAESKDIYVGSGQFGVRTLFRDGLLVLLINTQNGTQLYSVEYAADKNDEVVFYVTDSNKDK